MNITMIYYACPFVFDLPDRCVAWPQRHLKLESHIAFQLKKWSHMDSNYMYINTRPCMYVYIYMDISTWSEPRKDKAFLQDMVSAFLFPVSRLGFRWQYESGYPSLTTSSKTTGDEMAVLRLVSFRSRFCLVLYDTIGGWDIPCAWLGELHSG